MEFLVEKYLSLVHWLFAYFLSVLAAVVAGWCAVGLTGAIGGSGVQFPFDKSIFILLPFSIAFTAILAFPAALIFDALPELIGIRPRRVFLVPAGILAGYFVFFAISNWDVSTIA